jgi:pilus assembly protein CpaE
VADEPFAGVGSSRTTGIAWDENGRVGMEDRSREGSLRGDEQWVRRTRVLLAINDLGFHQEVLDFLERDPRVDVVGAVARPDALFQLEARIGSDITVVCPVLAREGRHPAARSRRHSVLVVGQEMTVPLLRDAIEAGAKGVFAWPEERDELVRTIAALRESGEPIATPRGIVLAVFGPRGGSGATFLASHLAAALADRGTRCVLVDMDGCCSDMSIALGIDPGQEVRTIADLMPVASELDPDHVGDALVRHSRGFTALLGAPDPIQDVPAGLYGAAVSLLAATHEVVVLHAARRLDPISRSGLRLADQILLVVSPDLFSLYSARKALAALTETAPGPVCRVVINAMQRGEIGHGQLERILGVRPTAAIRFDRAVGRAQEVGELLRARSHRAWRDVRGLADLLMSEAAGVARDESGEGRS